MTKFMYYWSKDKQPARTLLEARTLIEDRLLYNSGKDLYQDEQGYYILRQSLRRLTLKKIYYATKKETESKERNKGTENDLFQTGPGQ